MNKLHILTLNWQGEDKLKKLTPSVLNVVKELDWSWFIRDNASTDNSVAYLNSLDNKNIHTITYKNNLQNFASGMNHLFSVASPQDEDLILLLNNDVIFNDTSSIKNMINIIQKDKEVGAVGARLLYTGTNKLQHAGVVFDKNHKMPIHFRSKEPTDKNAERNREFQACTAAVMLTKAEYYKNVCITNKSGQFGMDEALIWSFDDIDACLAIKYNLGKKIIYCGKTNISHEESASLKILPQNKLYMSHNRNYFLSKWGNKYQYDLDNYTNNVKYGIYEK